MTALLKDLTIDRFVDKYNNIFVFFHLFFIPGVILTLELDIKKSKIILDWKNLQSGLIIVWTSLLMEIFHVCGGKNATLKYPGGHPFPILQKTPPGHLRNPLFRMQILSQITALKSAHWRFCMMVSISYHTQHTMHWRVDKHSTANLINCLP